MPRRSTMLLGMLPIPKPEDSPTLVTIILLGVAALTGIASYSVFASMSAKRAVLEEIGLVIAGIAMAASSAGAAYDAVRTAVYGLGDGTTATAEGG